MQLLNFIILFIFLPHLTFSETSWYDTFEEIYCSFKTECCRHPFIRTRTGIKSLTNTLKNEFFGQHLAVEITLKAIDSHFKDENPGKPLVLSFHGWAGSGKTYLSQLIVKSLYKEGLNSKYARFYMGSLNFPDPKKIEEYKEDLQYDIESTIRKCEQSIFIFDEVDKTPPGIFDAIVPFIDYAGGNLRNKNFRKAIYLFLSNSGSNDITSITYGAWKAGKARNQLTFKDFEQHISNEAFNKKGNGLFKSSMIDRILIDYFIPFLPMEKVHVKKCAVAEARRHKTKIEPDEIVKMLTFWPADSQLYSQTGCKRIESLVKYHISDLVLNLEEDELEHNEL